MIQEPQMNTEKRMKILIHLFRVHPWLIKKILREFEGAVVA